MTTGNHQPIDGVTMGRLSTFHHSQAFRRQRGVLWPKFAFFSDGFDRKDPAGITALIVGF